MTGARLRRVMVAGACVAFATAGIVLSVACTGGDLPSASADGPVGFQPASGPCTSEGAVRECHVKLGEQNGASGCFVGQQECAGGAWTPCGGTDVTLQTRDLSAPGLAPLAVPVSDAGICATDPCDPNCAGYNEDAGIPPEGGAPNFFFIPGADIFGGAPGGFAKKSDCGSSAKGCNDVAPGAPYTRKCNGEDHFSIWDSCLADTHCDTSLNGGQGECVANWDTTATGDPRWDETNQHWLPAVCPGVDITISAACEVGGVPGFNVCNRGNTNAVAANVGIYLDNGNGNFGSSTFSGGTCPNLAPSCSPSIPGGVLQPGKCFRVTNATCPAWTGSGNPVAYVNSNRAIAECGGVVAAGASTQPGCNNNWADEKHKGLVCGAAGATFVPTAKTFSYTATCTPGTRPRWKSLTYTATVPCSPGACTAANRGKVEFFGTLSRATPAATTAETVIGDATTQQTVNCTAGVDAGGQPKCPVNMTAWADGVASGGSYYTTLVLRVLLTPTPDSAAAPSVGSWGVAYDCVPNE